MPAVVTTARDIFLSALDQANPSERAAFINQACAGDLVLQRHVEALFRNHEQADSLLDQPRISLQAVDPNLGSPPVTIDQLAERIGSLIGPYKLLEQIGEGGFGVVFMAEQTEPVRRKVALKVLKPGMDTGQVVARFEAERQALAIMDHPHIARVFDGGATATGRPYFVMELVRGIPITEYCGHNHLMPRERLELFVTVCHAVHHAHQKGLIHRDLKPSNVLVSRHDTTPIVKIIDFGVAKALGQSLTDKTLFTGIAQMIGTPMYMSPEQAGMSDLDVDTRSDIYSLGVLLYELITGTTPFDKDRLKSVSFDEMRRIIREEEPETVSNRLARTKSTHPRMDAGVNRRAHAAMAELDWIVMKALEKDRSRRYESASALAADIQRYLSDEPVLACPPTTMYRFQKFARKHKASLSTAAAIAACLILGTTVSAWQAVRATTAEAQANANADQAQEKAQEANAQRDEAQRQRDEVRAVKDQLQRTLYAAHMNLAKHSWDAGGVQRVQELLDQHRPQPGQIDARGFEWHYLHRLCHSELLELPLGPRGPSAGPVIPGPSDKVAYSPDGNRLAGAAGGGIVKIWDAQTGKELLNIQTGNRGWGASFSPDGRKLAVGVKGGREGQWKIFDAQTGKDLLSLSGGYNTVVFSPDGKLLAGAGNNDVKIWDALTGGELRTLEGPADTWPSSAIFSPDGKRIAGAGSRLVVWDVEKGNVQLNLPAYTVYAVYATGVAFSPDGSRLACTVADSRVKVWNAQSGQEMHALELSGASSVSFTPDGKYLAGGTWRGITKIWEVETAKPIRTFKGIGKNAIYSPDGKRLVATVGAAVKVWDAQKEPDFEVLQRADFPALPGKKLRATFSANNYRTITIHDVQTKQELRTLTGHKLSIWSTDFSPDEKRLVSGGGGGSGPLGGVGRGDRAELKVWDTQTGELLYDLPVPDVTVISRVAFSPDGKQLASFSGPLTVPPQLKIWDAQTGREMFSLKGHTRGAGTGMVYSPDGTRLASASIEVVKLWDPRNGQEQFSFQSLGGSYQNLTFSSDGKRLAATGDGGAKVWDAQTGRELLALKGHSSEVRDIAFTPDGKRLATSSSDQTVKIWDAHNGDELLTFDFKWPTKVAFSADGHKLMVNAVRAVHIYDATPLPEKP